MEITLGGSAILVIVLMLCSVPIAIIVWRVIKRSKFNDNVSSINSEESSGNPTNVDAGDFGQLSIQEIESSAATKNPFTWRRLLVFSLLCLILLPCNFICTLGAGMSGDAGEFVTSLIIIAFLAHIVVTVISGAAGIAIWSISVLNKDN
mgnify:CR=1 FL=1